MKLNCSIFTEKIVYGIALIIIFTLFSLTYFRNVMMPQNGWWHYFAWRILEGDILYKDIYLYIPPYFALLTSFLYKIFTNNFFYYTIFIGYPVKLVCILIMYNAMTKITKPLYAALSVLLGACFSATYFMDVWYDYNPILMLPSLLSAHCIMNFYEKKKLYYIFISGVLTGILIFSKQNIGLAFAVAEILIILLSYYKEKSFSVIKTISILLLGIIMGITPGILYLLYYNAWNDFLNCMNIAIAAKGGTTGLFSHLLNILLQMKLWVIAIFASICIFYGEYIWKNYFRNKYSKLALIIVFITFVVFFIYKLNIGFLYKTKNIVLLLTVFALLISLTKSSVLTIIKRYKITKFILFTAVCVVLFYWSSLNADYHGYIYQKYHIFGIRRLLIGVFSYIFTIIWIRELIRYFVFHSNNLPILSFMTIVYTHFLVGIISANQFEELFMIMYVPWGMAYLFNSFFPIKYFKENCLTFFVIIAVCTCITSKIVIPYDWQGWRSYPVQNDDVYSDIKGLNGYKLPDKVNEAFSTTIELINKYTTNDDSVYQFANIPLFNVLTERKIPTYGVISWFDVLPDSIARNDAKKLRENNPKMIIWHNMSEKEWDLLESVFRNGKQSGQREIKRFYDEVVTNKYKKLYSFDNHRDGTIEVFLLER